jgi:hypothetical protein
MPGSSKDRLKQGLEGAPSKPEIQRGQGVRLSTQNAESQERIFAESQNRTNAESQKSDDAKSQKRRKERDTHTRINRGYMLREDYIKALKRLAVEEDKSLYEVMEEAFEAYLKSKDAI